jgi:hypothetical protein
MADEILKRDQNSEPVIGLVTDDASKEIRMGRIDDTTKGLKVMLVGGAGAGTVTSVSVATANGFSGTVANATTTPAITIIAGAITPTSVNGLTVGLGNNALAYNTAIGVSSLAGANSGSSQNTAIGYQSLLLNTSGAYNFAGGYRSLASNLTGSNNTGVGWYSLQSQTGNSSTGIGYGSLSNTTGNNNTAVGASSLIDTTTGSVGLGYYAGHYETGGNAFYVDNQDRTNTAGDKAKALLYGIFNATAASQTLVTNSAFSALVSVTAPVINATTGVQINGAATSGKILKGNGTNFVASTETYAAPGTSGHVLTSDGTNWTSAAPASGSPMTLLKGNSGTSTTTSAHNLDTVAISGLTALDQLVIHITCSAVTQNGGAILLQNSTDTVTLADIMSGNQCVAGNSFAAHFVLQQEQQSDKQVITAWNGAPALDGIATGGDTNVTTGFLPALRSADVTTAWTGSWTLAYRSGGVTSGGTVRWSWKVYKLAGQ